MPHPTFSAGPPAEPAMAASVRRQFAERFGGPPRGVWSAPGRVNLIGEHTDYNGGWVLPFAIERRTYAAVASRTGDIVRVLSGTTGQYAEFPGSTQPGAVRGWAAYVAGVVWSLRRSGYHLAGVDMVVDGDLPVGAGLASSAALECAVAMALADLSEAGLGPAELSRAAQEAENDYLGVPSGGMDQLACVHGRPGQLLLIDMRGPHIEQVPADFAAAGLRVLVVDTTVRHRVAGREYAQRRRECEAAASALGVADLRDADESRLDGISDPVLQQRARHVVSENARVLAAAELLRRSDGVLGTAAAVTIGALLSASHWSLRDDFAVSVPELDLAAETALANGALGARLTGAGFGGCVLALVPVELSNRVSTACIETFAARGLAAPAVFEVLPSDGARRESMGP